MPNTGTRKKKVLKISKNQVAQRNKGFAQAAKAKTKVTKITKTQIATRNKSLTTAAKAKTKVLKITKIQIAQRWNPAPLHITKAQVARRNKTLTTAAKAKPILLKISKAQVAQRNKSFAQAAKAKTKPVKTRSVAAQLAYDKAQLQMTLDRPGTANDVGTATGQFDPLKLSRHSIPLGKGWSDAGTAAVIKSYCTLTQMATAKGPEGPRGCVMALPLQKFKPQSRVIMPPLKGQMWGYDPQRTNEGAGDQDPTSKINPIRLPNAYWEKRLVFQIIDWLNWGNMTSPIPYPNHGYIDAGPDPYYPGGRIP